MKKRCPVIFQCSMLVIFIAKNQKINVASPLALEPAGNCLGSKWNDVFPPLKISYGTYKSPNLKRKFHPNQTSMTLGSSPSFSGGVYFDFKHQNHHWKDFFSQRSFFVCHNLSFETEAWYLVPSPLWWIKNKKMYENVPPICLSWSYCWRKNLAMANQLRLVVYPIIYN